MEKMKDDLPTLFLAFVIRFLFFNLLTLNPEPLSLNYGPAPLYRAT
jgi:hypothetical protein